MFTEVDGQFINFNNVIGFVIKQEAGEFIMVARDISGFSFKMSGSYKTEADARARIEKLNLIKVP